MGDAEGSTGDIQGVFEHMRVSGASGTSGGVKCMGHPNIWGCQDAPKHMGCQLNAPKCRTYMLLKKIRG